MSSSRSEQGFFAPCPRGLEALLASELSKLGARNAAVVPGGVAFSGDWRACYRANLWSRLASRVLWRGGGCSNERGGGRFAPAAAKSMDAVSDRDFAAGFCFAAGLAGGHPSRPGGGVVAWFFPGFAWGGIDRP